MVVVMALLTEGHIFPNAILPHPAGIDQVTNHSATAQPACASVFPTNKAQPTGLQMRFRPNQSEF
jgi:hypothetical protein